MSSSTGKPNGDSEAVVEPSDEPGGRVQECLACAIKYFHEQINDPIKDHTERGSHPDRPKTAHEYFESRGWEDETIDNHMLGWADSDSDQLKTHLIEEGYIKEELLGTGLFTEDLQLLWNGRYVFPYLNSDGSPVYAIARCTGNNGGGARGQDGHPDDFMSGKYVKLAHRKQYAKVSEPIYGLRTISDNNPVIVTEGIADAITVHEQGVACISPVTTRFKTGDIQELVSVLKNRDVTRVYVLQDAEQPQATVTGEGEGLDTPQFGSGVKGAIQTAKRLLENGISAQVNTPPQPGRQKVDLHNYLTENWGTLDALTRSAKPARCHSAYVEDEEQHQSTSSPEREQLSSSATPNNQSDLFSLGITNVTGKSEGYRGTNPLGHTGDSENYFVISGEWSYDHKRKVAYNALTYLLCEAGKRTVDNPSGTLSEKEYFIAWRHAKEQGLLPASDPIPHEALVHIAVTHGLCDKTEIEDERKLPVKAYNTALNIVNDKYGFDPGRDPYKSSDKAKPNRQNKIKFKNKSDSDKLTYREAQKRCYSIIDRALTQSQFSLIDALPAQGKSRGVVKWAAENDRPITVLAPRRELLSDEYADWCDELGLSYYTLPAFHRDCPTAKGEHEDHLRTAVMELYNAGVTAGEIHALAPQRFGNPLPCQQGEMCSYQQKLNFDLSDFDVLLGHYSHAYAEDVIDNRIVVIDETPSDAFINEFDKGEVVNTVTSYLKRHDDVPFSSYADLVENRDDEFRREDALAWFHDDRNEVARDGVPIMMQNSERTNAFDSMLTYALLVGSNLGTGWEHASLPGNRVCVRNRNPNEEHDESELYLLVPPDLQSADRVIGLDGTPWPRQWELCLGNSLDHYEVLNEDERAAYLQDALNYTIYQIGTATKPYSSGNWVTQDKDAVVFNHISEQERRKPALISSSKAISKYNESGAISSVNSHNYYGNIKGTNRFNDTHVGVVAGSPHYGDIYPQKWGAFANKPVERVNNNSNETSYTSIGNRILTDMRENEVLQALMRFGRNDEETTVYVITDALPDWVPIAETGKIKTWSDGMLQLVAEIKDRQEWRTSNLIDDDDLLDTSVSEPITARQVRRNLKSLVKLGFLDRHTESGGAVWVNTNLDDMNDTYQVVYEE